MSKSAKDSSIRNLIPSVGRVHPSPMLQHFLSEKVVSISMYRWNLLSKHYIFISQWKQLRPRRQSVEKNLVVMNKFIKHWAYRCNLLIRILIGNVAVMRIPTVFSVNFLRRKRDLGMVSRSELAQVLVWINGRQRKCLHWKTSY